MEIVMIIIVVLIILILVLGILLSYKSLQVKYFKKIAKEADSLVLLKKMFSLMGANVSSNDKLSELNEIFKEKFKAEFSTIVWYDGQSNVIKATNVDETYALSLGSVAFDKDFKDNVKRNVPKYLATTNNIKTLMYKTAIERKIRSAIFIPIVENNLYLGFWILESTVPNSFANIPKNELNMIKDNLSVFLSSVLSQEKIENLEDKDKQTGLYNNFYLYSKGQYVIENADTTAFIMIAFPELKKVNEYYGRKTGDKYLLAAIEYIRNSVNKQAVIIRYATGKILVLAPNISVEAVLKGIGNLQTKMKTHGVTLSNGKVEINTKFVLMNHTRHSSLDKTLLSLENKIDDVNLKDSIAII